MEEHRRGQGRGYDAADDLQDGSSLVTIGPDPREPSPRGWRAFCAQPSRGGRQSVLSVDPRAQKLLRVVNPMLQLITFSTLNGVLYGMLLFMMASGLTLIFSMMGVLNFAHASFYMLGAYFGFELSRRIGFWPGLVLAPLMVGVIGALVERFGLRHLHRRGHVSELLFTFGLAFVIEELVQMVWGKLPVDYRVPPQLDFVAFRLFDTTYPAYRVFMLLIAVGMFAALLALLTRTRVGLIIQAALTHPDMVAMLGHNVPKIFMFVFGAGTALAGLAGVIAGPALVTQPDMASPLGPILFVVIVVGGLG